MSVVEIPAQARRGLAVILHGRGANKDDLVPIGRILATDGWHGVLPDAPMPWSDGFAWYESDTRARDLPFARGLVTSLVEEKQKELGVDRDRTLLMGFSQGGVVSLDVSLNEGVAGLVGCLSGYLSVLEAPAKVESPPRIFVAHGTQDFLIRVAAARKTRRALEELGATVEYHEYEMGHEIVDAELAALRTWLARQEMPGTQEPRK